MIQPQEDFRRDNAGGGAARRRNIGLSNINGETRLITYRSQNDLKSDA